MKVLQSSDKFKSFEYKCSCGAILLVEENDIKYQQPTSSQLDAEPGFFYATCPECLCRFRVDEDCLTKKLKRFTMCVWYRE